MCGAGSKQLKIIQNKNILQFPLTRWGGRFSPTSPLHFRMPFHRLYATHLFDRVGDRHERKLVYHGRLWSNIRFGDRQKRVMVYFVHYGIVVNIHYNRRGDYSDITHNDKDMGVYLYILFLCLMLPVYFFCFPYIPCFFWFFNGSKKPDKRVKADEIRKKLTEKVSSERRVEERL